VTYSDPERSEDILESPAPLRQPKPRLRGRLHQGALYVAIPGGTALVAAARPGVPRIAAAVYAVSLAGLFAASSAYHTLPWSPPALRLMRSLDHSMIFFLIAGTYTPFGIVALTGAWRIAVLAVVWVGAVVGIALKLLRLDLLGRVGGMLYIVLGWTAILALPEILREVATVPLVLTVAGGLLYTTGALILCRRQPDPKPLVFGYHEVWHCFVVLGSLCHYVAIILLLRTSP
jgi:hemolysin III